MADQARSTRKSHEIKNESNQAQSVRLDESVMMGKGCEAQDIMQRGMGHGDALKEGTTGSVLDAAGAGGGAAVDNSGGLVADGNSNGVYPYSTHSLI